MREKLRWLAVPPALALLLVFGPCRGSPRVGVDNSATVSSARTAEEAEARPASTSATQSSSRQPARPLATPPSATLPDLSQIVSTVLGVCLLGFAVVFALARLRQRQQTAAGIVQLRQSLRLSGRHAVHAVQFDDQLLLLGESDGALRVLRTASEPAPRPALAAAARARDDDDDDGAVLKDMVLPRPPAQPARTASAAPTRGLADFRTLLRKSQADA